MSATTSTGNRETILVVDDDLSVLVLIQSILISANYRVLLATERADAIRIATQKHLHIDIALLDVRMPGMPATALADEIMNARPNVRVLFMSGYVDEEIVRIKLLEQYAGFIAKPFRNDGLLRAIEHALEAPAHAMKATPGAGMPAAAAGNSGSCV